MIVPGENLLDLALTIIATTTIQYYAFDSRATNEILLDVTTYAAPVDVEASVQAVPRKVYSDMGLDFNKEYIAIWASQEFENLMRDRPGDQVGFGGERYEIMEESDWFTIDGWDAVLAIKVPTP